MYIAHVGPGELSAYMYFRVESVSSGHGVLDELRHDDPGLPGRILVVEVGDAGPEVRELDLVGPEYGLVLGAIQVGGGTHCS